MSKACFVGGVMLRSHRPDVLAEWYGQTLGCRLEPGPDGGHYGVIEHAQSSQLHVGVVPRSAPNLAGVPSITLTFRVENLSTHIETLRGRGVLIREELQNDQGHFAFVLDPDGNEVALWGPLSVAPSEEETPK